MPLPIIQHPTYEVYLKSLDRKVKFRPFLVKEEKIMLIAKESEDQNTVIDSIKQVIKNCCVEDIDIENLPIFDIEMFFIHLRMRSVGEKVDLTFKCNKVMPGTDEVCNLVNEYELDLDKISYVITNNHSNDVRLSDAIGMKMKYPVLTKFDDMFRNSDDPLQFSLNLICENVVYIYDADQIYDRTTFTKDELMDFLSGLSQEQLDKILTFFATSPKVVLQDTVYCKKCNQEHKISSESLYDFFI